MTRTPSRAEAAKAPPKLASENGSLTALWTMPGVNITPPTLVDMLGNMSELQMGLSQFMAERIRKDTATLAALVTCRTPLDFLELWRSAAAETVSDYAEEAARILELQKK